MLSRNLALRSLRTEWYKKFYAPTPKGSVVWLRSGSLSLVPVNKKTSGQYEKLYNDPLVNFDIYVTR